MRCKRTVICAMLLLIVLGALGYVADAQQPGQWGRFRAMRALDLEAIWAQVSFELKTTDDQLTAMRVVFQKAWDQRKMVLEYAEKEGDWDEVTTELDELRQDLDKDLSGILTKDQKSALDEWLKERRERMERMRRQW